ncbi:hypothetical protein OK016_03655 [Vibrio chagasii]|nr:hypothetical protein [Vibrio chagasii]
MWHRFEVQNNQPKSIRSKSSDWSQPIKKCLELAARNRNDRSI